MNLEEKTILIYGMGISGKGVARLLKSHKDTLILYDKNEALDKEALKKELALGDDVRILTGTLKKEDLSGVDVLALSPGVSAFAPDIQMARGEGVSVLGELEIASEIAKGRLAAITGTNGKTTTTALTGEIMKAAFEEVFVVGNIGKSFASVANETTEKSVTVAEVSSFQLESISEFHPEVSAVLNLTPDHLDRHGTFENYAAVKMEIARNQSADEVCVINYDDVYLRELSEKITPKKLYFSRKTELEEGIFLNGDVICVRDKEGLKEIIRKDEMKLLGDHNVENVMAACGVALAMGVSIPVIRDVVSRFEAVEHRIEFVCEKRGVSYYNDSKGTNTDAAAKAVGAMTRPVILIAGGYDKNADYTDWIKGFHGKVRTMLLIGETAPKIKETALACGFTQIHMCETLENAVKKAAEIAEKGDAVLLSPACASWDQFPNYETRGTRFKEMVCEISE